MESAVEQYIKLRRRRFYAVTVLIALSLIAVFMLHLALGVEIRNPIDVLVRGFSDIASSSSSIERYRVQRALAGVAVGAALAVSGYLIQIASRNPLGDPYLLGISSGALFAVVISFTLPISAALMSVARPVAALIGGIGAYALTLYIAGRAGMTPTTLVLSGVAIGTFFYSVSVLPQYLFIQNLQMVFAWSQGSLVAASIWEVAAVASAVIIGTIYALMNFSVLNALTVSDDFVRDMGKDPSSLRRTITFLSALLASLTVAWFGIIGFVGLASPHLARRLLKSGESLYVFPIALMGGSLLVLGADSIAKYLFLPMDLPVNVIASLIGAPTLAAILVGMRKRA